ncbi:MAG: hypothetical protein LBV72_03440 [Tannerella sp.]|jgi:hypothetical protein|nr:hypothetical protein [Tannerella sp.]
MKRFLLFMVIVLIPTLGFAQKKVYVFKPQVSEFASTNLLEGKTIQVNYKDTRIINKKSKVECTFEELTSVINESLKAVFPKVVWIDSADADIILNIRVKRYEAFFPGGVWRGFAEYDVELIHGSDEVKEEILGTRTEGNIWGIKTAKKVLQMSFDRANEDLVKLLIEHLE